MKAKRKYLTIKQAATQLGLSPDVLKLIKLKLPEAFTTNQIYGDKILDYYNAHKELLVVQQSKSKEELQKEKLSNDIILQRIEIEEAKKQSVNVKEIEQFMTDLGIQLGALLKNRLIKELPPRITGLKEEAVTALCKEYYNEICKVLAKSIDNWNKADE